MKKATLLLAGISLLFALGAFKPVSLFKSGVYIELKNNNELRFNNGPSHHGELFASNFRRGAHDQSAFEVDLDTSGHIMIKNVQYADGKTQSELVIMASFGSISRNKDVIEIKGKAHYRKLYLIRMSEPFGVDTLAPNVTISFIPKTLENKIAQVWVSGRGNDRLFVLPKDTKIDEIWKSRHADNTIALFENMEVRDTTNFTKSLPAGNYVLIGGNSLTHVPDSDD